MDLNKTTKTLCGILFIAAFFALYSWASNKDYEGVVLYNMPQEVYEHIYLKLGNGCSDQDIVDEYMSNKKHYEALCIP